MPSNEFFEQNRRREGNLGEIDRERNSSSRYSAQQIAGSFQVFKQRGVQAVVLLTNLMTDILILEFRMYGIIRSGYGTRVVKFEEAVHPCMPII